MDVGARLASTGLSGITLYEPAELVIAARSGTPLSELVGVLGRRGVRNCPSSRWIIGRFWARGRTDHRRRRGHEYFRAPSHHGGCGARQSDRRAGRQRAWRGGQIRRPRDEERHRARSRQAACRLLGHARVSHRSHLQGPAAKRSAWRRCCGAASTSAAPSRRCRARSDRPSISPARRICRVATCRMRARSCGSKAFRCRSIIAWARFAAC